MREKESERKQSSPLIDCPCPFMHYESFGVVSKNKNQRQTKKNLKKNIGLFFVN